MHQREQQRTRHPHRLSATFALASIVGLTLAGAAGCGDDDDNTNLGRGGSAGAAGSAGRGGSAGSAGRGGSGGAAGTTAGSGGAAGSAGSAGSAGTAGTAGAAGASGDAGAPLSRQEMAEAICAKQNAVAECSEVEIETCVAGVFGGFAFYDSSAPGCTETIDAYHACLAAAPQSGFICAKDTAGPAEATCVDEFTAMVVAFEDVACDAVPDAGADGG